MRGGAATTSASRAPCRDRRRRAPGRGRDAPRRRTGRAPVRAPAAVGHHVPRRRLGPARLPHATAPHEAGARVRHSPEPADAPRHGRRRARPRLPALHARRLRRAHAARPGGSNGADRHCRRRARRSWPAPAGPRASSRSRRSSFPPRPSPGSCGPAPAAVHWWPRCRRRRSRPALSADRALSFSTPRPRRGRDPANPAILERTEGILATARDRNRRLAAPAGPSCRTPSDPVGAALLSSGARRPHVRPPTHVAVPPRGRLLLSGRRPAHRHRGIPAMSWQKGAQCPSSRAFGRSWRPRSPPSSSSRSSRPPPAPRRRRPRVRHPPSWPPRPRRRPAHARRVRPSPATPRRRIPGRNGRDPRPGARHHPLAQARPDRAQGRPRDRSRDGQAGPALGLRCHRPARLRLLRPRDLCLPPRGRPGADRKRPLSQRQLDAPLGARPSPHPVGRPPG